VLLLGASSVYTRWYVGLIQGSLLANVFLLCCAHLYANDKEYLNTIFTCISVAVAFVTFMIILIAQGVTVTKVNRFFARLRAPRNFERLENIESPPPPAADVELKESP